MDLLGDSSDVGIDTPDLSQEGKDLIDRTYQRSKKPPKSDINDQIAYGRSNLASEKGILQSGSMEDSAMARVISDRLNRGYMDKTARLQSKESLDTANRYGKAQQQGFAYVEAAERVKRRNAEMVLGAYRANQEARAAALRSLLQLGGMVAGAAIGGPAGAVVGSQVGGAMAGPQETPIGQGSSYDKYRNGGIGADLGEFGSPSSPQGQRGLGVNIDVSGRAGEGY